MRRRIEGVLALVLALGAIAAIAACGGESGEGAAQTDTEQATSPADGSSDGTDSDGGGTEGGSGESESGGDSDSDLEPGGDSDGELEADGDSESGSEAREDSESGEADGASAGLSKAQYVKRGDAICNRVPPRYQARLQKLKPSDRESPEAAIAKAAIPPLKSAVEEFEALGSPEGLEDPAVEVIAGLEKAITGLEENPKAELTGSKSPFGEFITVTKKLGFKTCPKL